MVVLLLVGLLLLLLLLVVVVVLVVVLVVVVVLLLVLLVLVLLVLVLVLVVVGLASSWRMKYPRRPPNRGVEYCRWSAMRSQACIGVEAMCGASASLPSG